MKTKPLWYLYETLFNAAEEFPEKTAFIVEGTFYSYSTALNDARRLAAVLVEGGLQRGDRVALFLDNTYTNIIGIYATLIAGGVFLIINPQTKSDKLKYILNDSGATVLISDTHIFSRINPVFADCGSLRNFYYTVSPGDYKLPRNQGCSTGKLSDLLTASQSIGQQVPSLPNDLAALIYTSGSTGNPKGVMMSHQAMLFAAQSVSYYLRLDATHTLINVLPLAFDYGLYQLLMSVLMGATLVLERSFTYPAKILKLINDFSVTVFPGVPTIYATLVGMHRRKPFQLPSVTRITNTAAALPPDYTGALHEIFPNALLFRMYGLTECKRVAYLEPELADEKPTSVGKAIPGTETFILDAAGKECPTGVTGILHVRGPHIMMGYWNLPEQSGKMLIPGKFPGERLLCTHDWFKKDKDGDLYFIGRSDDIIKSRGEKVSPVEVENVLLSMKGVREAAVIGIEDELLGQAIKAFVVLEDQSVTESMIKKHCIDSLENFMVPKFLEIVTELPKTESGKITKKGLR
ncbi:MAG: AMP-binding protein [Candidatus Latescibacteria bacterium]|nr:AMP-binding protein [Candidatus Latescibacterota bacterium]